MAKILLSIVVPTKNRYDYLFHLIDLLASFQEDDFEMVIQDNSDSNLPFQERIDLEEYSFIKYFYQKESLSQSGNSDLSILHSTGEYVCFIGDDDGVVRNIIDVVKFMKSNNIDSLTPRLFVYNWPDFVDNSRYKLSAVVQTPIFKGTSKFINVTKSLKNVIDDGFGSISKIPRVYQGIVKRECLDNVYKKYNTFFPGPSPDMANAIALSFEVRNFYYLNVPVIITGQSKSVGGGERMMSTLKKIEDVPFLPDNVRDIWDEKIPDLWCSDTVWPVSAIGVLRKTNLAKKINYERIYARFVFHHSQYKNKILNKKNILKYYKNLLFFYLEDIVRFIFARVSSMFSKNLLVCDKYIIRNIFDIKSAESIIWNKYIEDV